MGTSQSSNGSPSGVPMVPPWVDGIEDENSSDSSNENSDNDDNDSEGEKGSEDKTQKDDIAPTGRFNSTRRNLTDFMNNGSTQSMRRAVGQYVRKGYGGSSGAIKRFGSTITTGAKLYSALSRANSYNPVNGFDSKNLSGKTSKEIVDTLIEVLRPIDGTQDTEASRDSINEALSELLAQDENLDILSLTPEQCEFVTERFLAGDITRRFELDNGKHMQEKAGSITTYIDRLSEVKNYIKEEVSSCFRKITGSLRGASEKFLKETFKSVLKDTFEIFESYLK